MEEAIKQDVQRQQQDDVLMQKLEEIQQWQKDFDEAKPAMERRFNKFSNFLETYPFEEIMSNYLAKQKTA